MRKTAHPVVCFGETLWDILPHAKLPGGAPMNVAYHLNKLGKKPAIISRIGHDELGVELNELFHLKNIDTSFFQVDTEQSTGKVFAEIGENNEVHYDIIKPVAWDFIEWEQRFESLISKAQYFVFGSLATRNSESRNTLFQCLEIAQTKVLDINLRPPHFNEKMIADLLQHANMLKLNHAELHLVTGWFSELTNDEDRIKLLQDRFNLETVIVTKGAEGAILYTSGAFYHHDGYQVQVADTVGSGDSFLAALIAKMIDRAPPAESLDFASAMGAFVASCSGGCPDYKLHQVKSLLKKRNQTLITV